MLAVWLILEPSGAYASGEPYGLSYDTIGQAEVALKQAAIKSPQWHRRRDAIERDVSDVAFFVEQAWRASQRSDEAGTKEYAQHALSLLRRAISRGHFAPEDIAPVLTVIRRFLPNGAV